MSTEEEIAEWNYRYWERIGNLCPSGDPTTEQKKIASDEADAAIEKLKFGDSARFAEAE